MRSVMQFCDGHACLCSDRYRHVCRGSVFSLAHTGDAAPGRWTYPACLTL